MHGPAAFGADVPHFLMGMSMGGAMVLVASVREVSKVLVFSNHRGRHDVRALNHTALHTYAVGSFSVCCSVCCIWHGVHLVTVVKAG